MYNETLRPKSAKIKALLSGIMRREICVFFILIVVVISTFPQQIDIENILIERVNYNFEKINVIMTTFSKFFTDYKNMDILKYAVCKYLLPKYLYTHSLQLIAGQFILSLNNKCPQCLLQFYKTVQDTPVDFQWVAKIFGFVEKFSEYKLKIQAAQTMLSTLNFYANDIIAIYKGNDVQKLKDYLLLIEEELINTYTEIYMRWDQNSKECKVDFIENVNFNQCIKDKKIVEINKGNINCGCDNKIPIDTFDYLNLIPFYPLNSIFETDIIYSNHFLDKLKEARNFHYTFSKYLELNFNALYNLLQSNLDNNEKIIYELCTQECAKGKGSESITPRKFCENLTSKEDCEKKNCYWCEKSALSSCKISKTECNFFLCKNLDNFLKSKIKPDAIGESTSANCSSSSFNINNVTIAPYLDCRREYLYEDDVLKLCKKFNTIYVCNSLWVHLIGRNRYDTKYKDCEYYDVCKCFDKIQIDDVKEDIKEPNCKPLLQK